MGEEFLERLKATLREIGYTDDELHLELTQSGKVGGHILSDAFRGESQMNRQNQLWAELRQRLTPAELINIVALLTVTPAEVGEDD
jgi:acid stress-induced BolA-like protein IbaG/YrbA